MRTVSAHYLANYVNNCIELGCPKIELSDLVPGGLEALQNTATRFPVKTVVDVLNRAETVTGKADIGIICGKGFRPQTFELVGQAMMFSKTLRHASSMLNRFQSVSHTTSPKEAPYPIISSASWGNNKRRSVSLIYCTPDLCGFMYQASCATPMGIAASLDGVICDPSTAIMVVFCNTSLAHSLAFW